MLSYEQMRQQIYALLPGPACICELFPDHFVYELNDKYYLVGYEVNEDKVALGAQEEVKKQIEYVKVQASARLQENFSEDDGYKWRVRVVEFGVDLNSTHWTREPLVAALKKFEGAKVFMLSEAQHQAEPNPYGKSPREIVGWLSGATADDTGIEADLYILKSAKDLRDALVDSWERGNKDLLGLSVDLYGPSEKRTVAGKKVNYLLGVKNVTVDVVYEPAAGGKFIRMAAAKRAGQNKEAEMLERLLAALKASRPEAYKSIEAKVKDGTVTEDEVINLLAAQWTATALLEVTSDDNLKAASQVLDETRKVACGITLDSELSGSNLPDISKAKLKKLFAGKIFDTEALRAAINEEKEYLDKLTASGTVTGAGSVRVTVDDLENRAKMFDDFFEGKVHSIKAAYVNFTGDELVTGNFKAAKRFTASIDSSTLALALGDAIARKMNAEYNASSYKDWRKIVVVNPIFDFRTNRRIRIGGYGDLPTVGQGQPYGALASPGNEEATYAVTKKGGTEDITLEAIKNDDVGLIRAIPKKLGRAASRTLYKFVFDFLATNPTIYDSVALFHASHGNLGSTALAAASFAARRQAMLKQTELSSSEVLGIPPKHLVVPVDLDKTGYDLIAAPRNSDFNPTAPDFSRTLQMELIVVPYWTDTNNWFMVASPDDIEGIEIGFLDGKEEPEIFIQDQPNIGSMFSNDKLTYKIRHVYGGAVKDCRAFDGSLVA